MEITKQQIEKIIELSGAELFVENVDSTILSRLLVIIEQKMNFFNIPIELTSKHDIKILVVDDLELSIYQFTKVLKRIGVVPIVARTKEEALAEIKKSKFDYVITDLYLPDLQDGMEIIQNLSKAKINGEQNCHLIVISSTNDPSVISQCSEKIDKFVQKTERWHDEILKYIAQHLEKSTVTSVNFSKYLVDNKIVVYTPIRINNPKYIRDFILEINIVLAQGVKNIIINFEKINFFDIENANFFTDIYKLIDSQSGKVAFTNMNNILKQILDDIFISDIAKVYNSVDDAVKDIKISYQT